MMFKIGLILLFTGVIIIFFYSDLNTYSLILQFVALMLFLAGVFLIKKSNTLIEKNLEYGINFEKQQIKKSGNKIFVEFDNCKILAENMYVNKPVTDIMYAQVFNTMTNQSNVNKTTNIEKCYIIYNQKWKNKHKEFISEAIYMNKKNLEIKLFLQKNTYLYYDKLSGKYFFDLSFLS